MFQLENVLGLVPSYYRNPSLHSSNHLYGNISLIHNGFSKSTTVIANWLWIQCVTVTWVEILSILFNRTQVQWHIKCFTASFISLDPSTYMTLRGMWNIISESQPLVWELRVHMTRCSTPVTKTLWWSRFTPWRRWTRGGWLDTWRSWPGKVVTVLAPLLMFITQDTYRWIIHTGTCHDLNVIACRNTGVVADSKACLCWL